MRGVLRGRRAAWYRDDRPWRSVSRRPGRPASCSSAGDWPFDEGACRRVLLGRALGDAWPAGGGATPSAGGLGGGHVQVHDLGVSERLLASTPPELVVRDEEDDCVYLPGRRARQPLRQPIREADRRRVRPPDGSGRPARGSLLYNQACPSCSACQAIRVDVQAFAPSRSQRRAQAKGDASVTVELGPIVVDDRRLDLIARTRGAASSITAASRPSTRWSTRASSPTAAWRGSSCAISSVDSSAAWRSPTAAPARCRRSTRSGIRSTPRSPWGRTPSAEPDRSGAYLGARLGLSRSRHPGEPLDGLHSWPSCPTRRRWTEPRMERCYPGVRDGRVQADLAVAVGDASPDAAAAVKEPLPAG